MARVVKVPSLHFRVFICQVFFGSSIHGCTSLNHIFDINSCGSYLKQYFSDLFSSEESRLSFEITGFISVIQSHLHVFSFLHLDVVYPISGHI
jgi:hypothetical protein